jgi:hypothetical protein
MIGTAAQIIYDGDELTRSTKHSCPLAYTNYLRPASTSAYAARRNKIVASPDSRICELTNALLITSERRPQAPPATPSPPALSKSCQAPEAVQNPPTRTK